MAPTRLWFLQVTLAWAQAQARVLAAVGASNLVGVVLRGCCSVHHQGKVVPTQDTQWVCQRSTKATATVPQTGLQALCWHDIAPFSLSILNEHRLSVEDVW